MSILLLLLSQISWIFLLISSKLSSIDRRNGLASSSIQRTDSELSVIIAFREDKISQLKSLIELISNEVKSLSRAEIIVVEDGCRIDNSSHFSNDIVKYFGLPQWNGKSVAQNFAIKQAKFNPVLLLDSDVVFDEKAICNLLSDFDCKKDGVVSGNLVFHEDNLGNNSHSTSYLKYWSMERKCRHFLDTSNLLLTASGPCMLVNNKIWPDTGLPANFGDDCALPFYAAVKGYNVRMDTNGPKFYDLTYSSVEAEKDARIRMAARNINATLPFLSKLSPNQILSVLLHRLGRWYSPVLFIVAILMALLEAITFKYYLGLMVFIFIFVISAISLVSEKFQIIRGFLLINNSFLQGVLLYHRGRVAKKYGR